MGDLTSALEFWPAPPPGGMADDLDSPPSHGPNGEADFFKHVELIDGALVFLSQQRRLDWARALPQRTWAVEGARGTGHLLAQQLVAAGERVLDVQPKLGARVRLLAGGT